MGLNEPGCDGVAVAVSDSPTRKYAHTWEMVEADLGQGPVLVGINTGHPEPASWPRRSPPARIAPLAGYASLRREVKYGAAAASTSCSRIRQGPRCYVEIKNVHMMRRAGLAEFPDCVTERGVKHLRRAVGHGAAEGHRAVMVYLIQRADATALPLARDVDPTYGAAFDAATAAGVEAMALRCRMTPEEIAIDAPVRFAA